MLYNAVYCYIMLYSAEKRASILGMSRDKHSPFVINTETKQILTCTYLNVFITNGLYLLQMRTVQPICDKYIHTHIHTHTYIRIHIHIHTYTYQSYRLQGGAAAGRPLLVLHTIGMYMCVYVCVCICMYMYVHVRVCIDHKWG
jgi:hypothetical protein